MIKKVVLYRQQAASSKQQAASSKQQAEQINHGIERKRDMKTTIFGTLFAALVTSSALAGWDEAKTAYQQGRYALAYKECKDAASQGDINCQNAIAILYHSGQGVPQDYQQAAAWYRKAAEQGSASAQYNLSVMYTKGQGVPQDYQQAAAWFRKAAEQGDASAQYSLGLMYDDGKGVPQDYKQAVAWYRKAAERGDASAQLNLGAMYYNGQGVPQNLVLAYTLFNLSAAQGNDKAVKNRDQLLPKLSPRQVQEGQRLASEWQPGRPLPTKSTTGK